MSTCEGCGCEVKGGKRFCRLCARKARRGEVINVEDTDKIDVPEEEEDEDELEDSGIAIFEEDDEDPSYEELC